MSLSTIVKGKDGNPVVLIFGGIDLTTLTEIRVKFGNDVRTLTGNPESVVVNSSSELELNFQDTTETFSNHWCIDGTLPNGKVRELTSACLGNLSRTDICG